QRQHALRLVLAGWPPQLLFHASAAWAKIAKLPVVMSDDAGTVVATDAVFWLGSSDGAAHYLANLRKRVLAAPFWLGPQGGDPVFGERSKARGLVHWATWLGAD